MNEFQRASLAYSAQGIATHPLRLNDEGFAKVAIIPRWETIKALDSPSLDWSQAKGIGAIGGSNSHNLGFIDVDDDVLAMDVVDYLCQSRHNYRMAWTARGRVHVWVREPKESPTRKLRLRFQERDVLVELRSHGAYVAVPPTPLYQWVVPEWPIWEDQTLSGAWAIIAAHCGVTWPLQKGAGGPENVTSAGYPTGWANRIGHGERNDACFYEAASLKDGRVPMEQAWAFMQGRITSSYDPPLDWRELRRTFESAYRKPISTRTTRVQAGGITWWESPSPPPLTS